MSTSPPSNWHHPAFCLSSQAPLGPASRVQTYFSKSGLLSFTLVAASLQTALPQVLHSTARLTKVQMSFPAGLCPSHLKISITNKQWQLFNEAFQGLSPPTTHFSHLERSKDVVLRNILLMWATPPRLVFPLSEVVLGFCSHFPCQGYAFQKQRRGPTQTPTLWHRALAQSRCSVNK